jgi:hypothetical protein
MLTTEVISLEITVEVIYSIAITIMATIGEITCLEEMAAISLEIKITITIIIMEEIMEGISSPIIIKIMDIMEIMCP